MIKKKITHIEFPVYSEMYGVTTACVLDIEYAIRIGGCDCGDGEAYYFTRHELEQLKEGLYDWRDFTPSSKLPYPLNILALLKPDGNRMEIPQTFRFKKKEFNDLKREIKKAGGDYNKNGYDFEEDAVLVYDRIINGEDYNIKKKFQFYATTPNVADEIVRLADIVKKDHILEPQAGQGAIIKACNKISNITIDAIELMPLNREILQKTNLNFRLIGEDFLKMDIQGAYTKILANPPFTNNQDISHIYKMYEALCNKGRLVTLASTHWKQSSGKKESKFREWLDINNARIIDIEAGEFKESGSSVPTCIIVIDKI